MKEHLEKLYGALQKMDHGLNKLESVGREFPEIRTKLAELRVQLKSDMNPEKFQALAMDLSAIASQLDDQLRPL